MFAPYVSRSSAKLDPRSKPQRGDAASLPRRLSFRANDQVPFDDRRHDRQRQLSGSPGHVGLLPARSAPISPVPPPQILSPRTLQTKLRIGSLTDPREGEADRIADQVMRMSVPHVPSRSPEQIQRKGADCEEGQKALKKMPPTFLSGQRLLHADVPALVQRKCQCEDEETKVQRKHQPQAQAGTQAGATTLPGRASMLDGVTAPPAVHDVLGGAGEPLDAGTREFFEPRFGFDFGKVRIHADRRAARSADAIGARAYTAGSHIVFSSGEYRPGAESGRRLLAHELAHTIQQSAIPTLRTQQDDQKPLSRDTSGNVLRRAPGCQDLMNMQLKEAAQVSEREVQDALVAQIPGSMKELRVPDSSFTAQRINKKYEPSGLRTGTGRIDIFVKNPPVLEVMELKHGDSPEKLADGLGQLRNYVEVGNSYGNDDLRQQLGVDTFVPMPPSRYPSSHIRAGATEEPVTLRWCVPGLLAYRALREQDRDLFVCTARDQGKVDAFLNGKLTRGWDVVDDYIDKTVGPKIEAAITSMPISDLVQRLLSNPAGRKMLEKALPGSSVILDSIDGKLVGKAAEELLKDFAPQIRAVALDFKRKLIDRVRQAMRDKMHDLLQTELNALCATATVLTMAEILAKLKENMPKLFMDEVAVLVPVIAAEMLKELLAEAALALLEAIALICGIIVGLIAAYLAAAALAAIEVGALIEAGIAAAIRALQSLVPAFAMASPAPTPRDKTEAPAAVVV